MVEGRALDPVGTSAAGLRTVFPVVRLVSCGLSRGGGTLCSEGSGYFLDRWMDTIVTASHVVTGKQQITPKTVEVHVWHRGRKESSMVRATATAYSIAADVAVIRLDASIAGLQWDMPDGSTPALSFQAKLFGWRGARRFEMKKVTSIAVKARRKGSYIQHLGNEGVPKLSGGPLLRGDDVVGIYRGRRPTGSGSQGKVSTLLDIGLLEQLRSSART